MSVEVDNKTALAFTSSQKHRIGVIALFCSTFFQLSGIFMLAPLLLFLIKSHGSSNALAGLFVACGNLGVFLITPVASNIAHRLGRRRALWVATIIPLFAAAGVLFSRDIYLWFVLELLAGLAIGLRWVLAESYIPEMVHPKNVGKIVGAYATLVASTFVIGPGLLAMVGSTSHFAPYIVLLFFFLGFLCTFFVPDIPNSTDDHSAHIGFSGMKTAMALIPVALITGILGGFFENGMFSVLPLYGLELQYTEKSSIFLAALNGFGGAISALSCGIWIDRMKNPQRDIANARKKIVLIIVLASFVAYFAPALPWLAWLVAFAWGAAGGSLYTFSMLSLAKTQRGIALINATAILVLSYTLGGVIASVSIGAVLEWSYRFAFPSLLLLIAVLSLWWVSDRNDGYQ